MFIKIASLFSAIFVVLVTFTWTDSAQEMFAGIRQLQEIIGSNATNKFSNDIRTSTSVVARPFYVVLTPVNESLEENTVEKLLFVLEYLLKDAMRKKYSHGFGSDFQQMSPLEISSITYDDINARRHLLNDEYHHRKIPAKRKRLESEVRKTVTLSSAKLNIESLIFFFEGNWIDDSALPSVSDVQGVISDVITSDSFTGTLKLTKNEQLQLLDSTLFGFEETQSPTMKPTRTITNRPTYFPTKRPQSQPSGQPTVFHSNHPSLSPTDHLSLSPTDYSSSTPTAHTATSTPTDHPTTSTKTDHPTSLPTNESAFISTSVTISVATLEPTNPKVVTIPPTETPTIEMTNISPLVSTNPPSTQRSLSPSNPKVLKSPESQAFLNSLNEDIVKQRKIPIVAIMSSVAFLVVVVLFLLLLRRQKRRRKNKQAFYNHQKDGEDLEFGNKSFQLRALDSLSHQKSYPYTKKDSFSPPQSNSNAELYSKRIDYYKENFMNSSELDGNRNFVLHKDMFCLNDDPSLSTGGGVMLYGGSLGDPRQIETPKENVLEPSHFKSNDIQSIRSSSSSDENNGDFEFAPDDTWDPDDAIEDDHSQSFVESPACSSSTLQIQNLIKSPASLTSIKNSQSLIIGSSTSMSSKSGHHSYIESPSSNSTSSRRNLNMSYSSSSHGSYRMQMLDLDDMKEENIIL